MLIRTGPGKYAPAKSLASGEWAGLLYNFDIDGSEPKREHYAVLRWGVAPILYFGGNVAIVGLTDTTGDVEYNYHLAERRAARVRAALFAYSEGSIVLNVYRSLGEQLALMSGVKNNTNSERWRSVWVHARSNSMPAPPVGPPRASDIFGTGFATPPMDISTLEAAGQGLDILSWVISVINASDLIPIVDFITGAIDGLFALVATWAAADRAAYVNGYILGYDNAMRDMASAYGDPALDRTPIARWPAIPHPGPHSEMWPARTDPTQDAGHDGERAGCEQAFRDMEKLERTPYTVYKDYGRRGNPWEEIPVRISGKFYLRWLAKTYRGEVAAYIVTLFNQGLAAKGKRPYPTL